MKSWHHQFCYNQFPLYLHICSPIRYNYTVQLCFRLSQFTQIWNNMSWDKMKKCENDCYCNVLISLFILFLKFFVHFHVFMKTSINFYFILLCRNIPQIVTYRVFMEKMISIYAYFKLHLRNVNPHVNSDCTAYMIFSHICCLWLSGTVCSFLAFANTLKQHTCEI